MNISLEFQRAFLSELQRSVGKENLVPVLKSELCLSLSSIYKRINLARLFSIEEILQLSVKFKISIDEILKKQSL